MIIEIFPNSDALAQATAERFVTGARAAIAERGVFYVCLSGGHTPKPAYEMLAKPPYVDQVDWHSVHVFWGDERNVPEWDPNSNEGMARAAFIDSVPIPSDQVHAMFNGGSAEQAAASYEQLLKRFFNESDSTFDLLFLGVGPDGHTASLFPGSKTLTSTAWAAADETETLAVRERITLTPAVLCRSRSLVFAVEGADKAQILKQIIDENADYPAGIVARCGQDVTWMLDQAAASLLQPS